MLKLSRKNIWEETVVPYVIDIIIHMNPDGGNGGDSECESSDTKDRHDCSSSVDMDL